MEASVQTASPSACFVGVLLLALPFTVIPGIVATVSAFAYWSIITLLQAGGNKTRD